MTLPIIAVVDVLNYGTMLQSYALQKALMNIGYKVEIINYPHREFLRQIPRLFNLHLVKTKWKSIKKNRMMQQYKAVKIYNEKKNQAFISYREECLIMSKELSNRRELVQYAEEQYAVVLGSDQVWNPVNLGRDYFTMTFVPQKVMKIAYAPSFGVGSIPKMQRKKTKKYLERIDFLSSREESGAKIIRELTGREVKVVCDPTLLLTSDFWRREERKVESIPEKYIFCYFLGNSKKNRGFAEELKKRTGYKIVHLPFMDEFVEGDRRFGDIIPQGVGPRQFLYLIHQAAYVCTDSFHGTVFSLLFHRSFYSMPRTASEGKASTSSRIADLLEMVKLRHRFINNFSEYDLERLLEMEDAIRWSEVDESITGERVKSMDYLLHALEGQGIENN